VRGVVSVPANCFELRGPARTYLLFTDTPEGKVEWVAAIKHALMELVMEHQPERVAVPGWHHALVTHTLWWAALHGDTDVLTQLLRFAEAEEGERVGHCTSYPCIGANDADEDGVMPLHYAASCGHAAAVEALIMNDASKDEYDPNRR